MITLSVADLKMAFQAAHEIKQLQLAHDAAQDVRTVVDLAQPTAVNPLGKGYTAYLDVTVSANDIRIGLTEKMAPLYAELHRLGIELKL